MPLDSNSNGNTEITKNVIYFTFVFIFYCMILITRLDFSHGNWGKVVNTIYATYISNYYGLRILLPQNILSAFALIKAFLVSFMLAIFIAVTFGVIILSLNLTMVHSIGLKVSYTSGLLLLALILNATMRLSYRSRLAHKYSFISVSSYT